MGSFISLCFSALRVAHLYCDGWLDVICITVFVVIRVSYKLLRLVYYKVPEDLYHYQYKKKGIRKF